MKITKPYDAQGEELLELRDIMNKFQSISNEEGLERLLTCMINYIAIMAKVYDLKLDDFKDSLQYVYDKHIPGETFNLKEKK